LLHRRTPVAIANAVAVRQGFAAMPRRSVPFLVLLLAAALPAAGCTRIGVATGAAATAGVAASEERGIDGTASDAAIRLQITDLWLDQGFDFYNALKLQIYDGRVMLTGRVPTRSMAETAVGLTRQVPGVRDVINEITIGDSNFSILTSDTVTASKLQAELTFTRGVHAINYSVRVVDGTVYLLGVAQNAAELDRVIRTARAMRGVRGVVSHVLLKDAPRRAAADRRS
jgi:osmotically-inducible protein OsmY